MFQVTLTLCSHIDNKKCPVLLFRHSSDNDNSLQQKGTLPGTIYSVRFDLKKTNPSWWGNHSSMTAMKQSVHRVLEAHLYSQTGVKPFKCETCGKLCLQMFA